MKIVHVYKDYAPVLGGIENHLRWQAEGMRAAEENDERRWRLHLQLVLRMV
jgi:hypothetical protein